MSVDVSPSPARHQIPDQVFGGETVEAPIIGSFEGGQCFVEAASMVEGSQVQRWEGSVGVRHIELSTIAIL
jgi:hypothetical protein